MPKQLKFTKAEQKIITDSIAAISQILVHKMEGGIENPCLEGTMQIDKENTKVDFSFTAQS